MNERIGKLVEQAEEWNADGDKCEVNLTKFAELIVVKCAQLACDTDLEDIEGGDSEVLRAAKRQILEHFGVEE